MRFGLKRGFADRFWCGGRGGERTEFAPPSPSRPVRQTWDGRNAAPPPREGGGRGADRPGTGAPLEPVSSGGGCYDNATGVDVIDSMILPQVHLRKPCYDFSFL